MRRPHLANFDGSTGGHLAFDKNRFLAYLKTWCSQGNDCPDGQYQGIKLSDCTHFVSHALLAGGVVIKNATNYCPKGACVRVRDLFEAFYTSLTLYGNVRRISIESLKSPSLQVCFITKMFELYVDHVIVLDKFAVEPIHRFPIGFYIYGHSNNRCSTLESEEKIVAFDDAMVIFEIM